MVNQDLRHSALPYRVTLDLIHLQESVKSMEQAGTLFTEEEFLQQVIDSMELLVDEYHEALDSKLNKKAAPFVEAALHNLLNGDDIGTIKIDGKTYRLKSVEHVNKPAQE